MGVSIAVWRARIGMFCGNTRGRSKDVDKNGISVVAAAVNILSVISILLLIGNIEPNPGPFPCKFQWCSVVPETLSSSVRHQQYHATNNQFMFNCPACGYGTKSFNALNTHVSLQHREIRHQITNPVSDNPTIDDLDGAPVPTDAFCCAVDLCSYSNNESVYQLVQHLIQDHINTGVDVKCPLVNNCKKFHLSFKKTLTFRTHLSQYHKGWRDEGCPKEMSKPTLKTTSTTAVNSNRSHPEFDSEMNNEQDTFYRDEETEDPDLFNDELIRNNLAKFYLQMYGVFCLPFKTIQEISENLSYLSEVMHRRMKIVLSNEMKQLGIQDDKIRSISYKVFKADLLYTTHHTDSHGPSFTSDYFRKKYFRDNFNYIEPIEENLTGDPKSKSRIQIVPITQTLTTLLADPSVEREVQHSFSRVPDSSTNLVSNYTEGSQFLHEDHPVQEIHLNLYLDGVNPVMNVLGSAKNKFKSLFMYFTIGNLQPHNRSKVTSKHLVALVAESVFKALGAAVCFKTVIDEINLLEQVGMMFRGFHVNVCIEYILGDNLGQHMIGGFCEYFSGDFFCRFCKITKARFRANPAETNRPVTKEEFTRRASRAEITGTQFKGITGKCAFNSLKYFFSTSSLPPCIGHDLFEGVVSWDLSGIISSFVNKHWFTYKLLNRRIKQFKCKGVDVPNKPAPVNISGKKLGGHAVQNWMLLRLLPFIIGDKILNVNDPGWQLYLKLKKLCEHFCGHSFLKSDLAHIKYVLLPDYFAQREITLTNKKKYPLRPKHHFMAHYPDLMLKFGPLIQVWTLGHEQKHKFFKHFCRMSQNFKNIQYSCAIRHQLNLCYLSFGELYPQGSTITRSQQLVPSYYFRELANLLRSNFSSNCLDCHSVEIDGGLSYSRGDFVLLSAEDPDIVGGFIKVIVQNPSDNYPTFVLEEVKAFYDPAKAVHKLPFDCPERFIIISYNDLPLKQTQPLYKIGSHLAFSIKSKIHQRS